MGALFARSDKPGSSPDPGAASNTSGLDGKKASSLKHVLVLYDEKPSIPLAGVHVNA
jgi:hypothetical protein